MEPEDKIHDAATDYSPADSVYPPELVYPAFVSTLLEDAAIRHCLVGDVVAKCMGYPVLITLIFAAVDDPQLADAGAVLKAKGFVNHAWPYFKQPENYPVDWPGYVFAGPRIADESMLVYVVPSSFWHHNLEPANYGKNTVLLAQHNFRLPTKVHYMDGLISFYAHHYPQSGFNLSIMNYVELQFSVIIIFMGPVLDRLPPEDQLFLDLIHKVLIPEARFKVCLEWQKIRRAETTVEEARRRIPRKDLAFAKYKAEVDKRLKRKAEEAKGQKVQLPSLEG